MCQTFWIVLISLCYIIKCVTLPVHPTTDIFCYFLSWIYLSVTVLSFLRWRNTHKIDCFKHTVLWHYVCSRCCTTGTTIHIWKFFIFTNWNFVHIKHWLLFSPSTRHWQPPFYFLSQFDYFRNLIEEESYSICPIVTGLFHLVECLQDSLML